VCAAPKTDPRFVLRYEVNMAMNENNLDFFPPAGTKSKMKGSALHPLHEAALRLTAIGINRPKERTRDLVAMLLSHGARAWRHSQPEIRIHLHVCARSGSAPLRLRLR
jgi:hypothetical protein